MTASKPTVMCFSGIDPSGGAGLQADIETLFSIGCHCSPQVTALTVQNTLNVISLTPVAPTQLIQQARAILEDMPIDCFKIGLVGSVACIEVLHTLLTDYPDLPVVLDPVINAGGGQELSDAEIVEAIITLLLPHTSVLTPNSEEIRKLAPGGDNDDACANVILETGCKNILLTGTHSDTPGVINTLYQDHLEPILFNWPRLEHVYHGSGCTLAAAIAGFLSHKSSVHEAVQQAQRFTWESLSHGSRLGMGQLLPNRSFWNKQPF